MAALIKLGYEAGVTRRRLVFYRFAFGLPPLLIWIARAAVSAPGGRNGRWPICGAARSDCRRMIVAFGALTLLPLAEATTIGFVAPLFAVALSALILGERSAATAGRRSRSALSACWS